MEAELVGTADVRFLPSRYRNLDIDQLNRRIAELRRRVGE
jgi:hypothetical protein